EQRPAQPPAQGDNSNLPWVTEPGSAIAAMLAQPDHLGWGSGVATRAVRRAWAHQQRRHQETTTDPKPPAPAAVPSPATAPTSDIPQPTGELHLLPDLALAMLKQDLAAPGRLWWLLRHLDRDGRGWHEQGRIRRLFTKTAWRFCGRRQLANLLKDGQGTFWSFGRGRIWLFSAGRVAHKLGVDHASYRPVAVPIQGLLGKVGLVRAHFYASYHSARANGNGVGMPVARETIAALTGVEPHAQRDYENRLGLAVQTNIAVGEAIQPGPEGEALAQERAWRHGRALFTLVDYQGKQGEKGHRYHAWQLPNSYGALHEAQSRGKRRRVNRQLMDLQEKGAGNDRVGRRYFANGKLLDRARGPLHVD
ncbi:MAG: hypothetical protein KDE28_24650, partial [Anaerolineales bacterium]|nr:hypothetical protein [Anaerolineales bacterium]